WGAQPPPTSRRSLAQSAWPAPRAISSPASSSSRPPSSAPSAARRTRSTLRSRIRDMLRRLGTGLVLLAAVLVTGTYVVSQPQTPAAEQAEPAAPAVAPSPRNAN